MGAPAEAPCKPGLAPKPVTYTIASPLEHPRAVWSAAAQQAGGGSSVVWLALSGSRMHSQVVQTRSRADAEDRREQLANTCFIVWGAGT